MRGLAMIKLRLGIVITMCLLLMAGLPLGCASTTPPGLKVITGTSLIANIVEDIGGEKVVARNVIPPGSCPGHYDIKPGDIKSLAEGDVFLIHDWQQEYENITGLISAADNSDLIIKVIEIKGNWMAPPYQAEAVDKIAAVLSAIDPENSGYYQERSEERRQAILAKGDELQTELETSKVNEVSVICSSLQTGFVVWAGFEVVATYGRPEELTPAKVADIVANAKAAGVALVIDNLQSGPEAGKAMAQDIGAVQITISFFPGGFEQTETWEKAIAQNIDLLLEALAQYSE